MAETREIALDWKKIPKNTAVPETPFSMLVSSDLCFKFLYVNSQHASDVMHFLKLFYLLSTKTRKTELK